MPDDARARAAAEEEMIVQRLMGRFAADRSLTIEHLLRDAVAQATRAERERLRPWMTHQSGCATWTLETEEFCTCKLAEALRGLGHEPP